MPANGCTPLTNAAAVSGKIALVIRGACDFTVKYLNAQAAGRAAIVVYNDGTATDRIDPLVMAADDENITIPGLMIGYPIGAQLATTANVTVSIDQGLDPTQDDKITGFSSRGPGHGGSTFKPDLPAPGENIVSAGVGTGTGSANSQRHLDGFPACGRRRCSVAAEASEAEPGRHQGAAAKLHGECESVGRHRPDAPRRRRAAHRSRRRADELCLARGRVVRPAESADADSRTERVRLKNSAIRAAISASATWLTTPIPAWQVKCPSNVRVGGKGSSRSRSN